MAVNAGSAKCVIATTYSVADVLNPECGNGQDARFTDARRRDGVQAPYQTVAASSTLPEVAATSAAIRWHSLISRRGSRGRRATVGGLYQWAQKKHSPSLRSLREKNEHVVKV